jgi:RNA polymerase sigma-70 factor (ECF subfamily)
MVRATRSGSEREEDAALIRQALAGRQRAYAKLVARHQDAVYSVVRRMVRSDDDADDLCQEAFVAAFRSLDRFDLDRPFRSWLLRIASNLTIDHLRREKRWKGVIVEDSFETYERSSAGPTPLEHVEARETAKMLEVGMASLPPEQRMALLLRVHQGLSYQEISEAMRVPVGSVKTWLHRARIVLREYLTDSSKED